MVGKYVVFATILLLSLSSTVSAAIAVSPYLCTNYFNPSSCIAVGTHGPLVSTIKFSVIPGDSALERALTTGAIQDPEWTFAPSSFASMTNTSTISEGNASTYKFDGIAFNTLRPYVNSVYFRQAMAYLTNYTYIQNTVLSSVGGTASINFLPCSNYPGACYSGPDQYYVNNTQTDLLNAYRLLTRAGLHPGNKTDVANLADIPDWYAGPDDEAVISNTTPACGPTNDSSVCVFRPLFLYRSDDPLRTELATGLCSAALEIGLRLNCQGITGTAADAEVYGESSEAVVSPGVYNPATGYNTAPVFNATVVNGTSSVSPADDWDMYTFGWATSNAYTWTYYFFNSQYAGTDYNFVNYYNSTIDYLTNAVYYASTIGAAQMAATTLAKDLQAQLPYLMGFYLNQLYAVYQNGWTGYANEPSTGPTTGAGLYWTLLNVHPTSEAVGGTFNLALHQVANQSGMNPLYYPFWVWQSDVWNEIYDTPLASPPTALTTANDFFNYMTTGNGSALSQWVKPYSGTTGTGTGWFQTQGTQGVGNRIVDGQVITFTFRNNITWTDNVPLTAYDYNYSLYAWDLTGNSGAYTPDAYEMEGPAGLTATYINSSDPYTIQMYVNSSSIWNLGALVVPVLPMHILDNFNVADLATPAGAVDFTQPSTSTAAGAASSTFCGSGCLLNDPTWMQYLPNLEVGSGPFYLYSYAGVTNGTGELVANTNYQRAAWRAIAALPANTIPATATTFSLNTTIQEFTYNPTNSTATFGNDYGSLASHAIGYVGITNATVSIQLYNSNGTEIGSAVTAGITQSKSEYTALIKTSSLTPGAYEIVVTANYSFLGLARTWYQASGFTMGSKSTSTISSTTIIAVLVITIMIILAAVYVVRKGLQSRRPDVSRRPV